MLGSELRYGRRGSLSIALDRGTWFDFAAGTGGGVIDLVAHMRRVGRPEAMRLLRERGLLERKGSGDGSVPARRRLGPSRQNVPVDVRVSLARALWRAASIDLRGTPGRTYLESRGVWRPEGYGYVRWLCRERCPSPMPQSKWGGLPSKSIGALLCAHVRGDEVMAVALEALEEGGRRLSRRWRRAFGARAGAAFRVRKGVDVLHLAEGEVDALAVALSNPGSVYGVGGTSGFVSCASLVGEHREVVIHADSGGTGHRAAIRGLASIRALGLSARLCFYRDDPAAEVER